MIVCRPRSNQSSTHTQPRRVNRLRRFTLLLFALVFFSRFFLMDTALHIVPRDGDKVGPDKSPTSDMSRIIIDAGVAVERENPVCFFLFSGRRSWRIKWLIPSERYTKIRVRPSGNVSRHKKKIHGDTIFSKALAATACRIKTNCGGNWSAHVPVNHFPRFSYC